MCGRGEGTEILLGSRAVTSVDKASHEFPTMSIELNFWGLCGPAATFN